MRQLATGKLPFGFTPSETAYVRGIDLRVLMDAVLQGDEPALAAIRMQAVSDTDAFDRFVGGLRSLAASDFAKACADFADIEAADWRMPAASLHAIAAAAAGDCGRAIGIAHQMSDFILAPRGGNEISPTYARDADLHREVVRCIRLAEASCSMPSGPMQIEAPFRYIVGYPRSGNTLLVQYLSYAFAAPAYTVYPAASRYFSRRFPPRAPGHPVFVKDHVLRAEYAAEAEILSPIRDGRDAMVSLARYLYAEKGSPFIQRGELADFLSYVSARMPYGFWGAHTRALLEARDRGVGIRLLHYQDLFDSCDELPALARELANGDPVPCVDRENYLAFVARERQRLALRPQWAEGIPLPDNSFIPRNWSIGGATIDWRRAFDKPARRRFHDLGGTDMLIRLGYETDADWWRQG